MRREIWELYYWSFFKDKITENSVHSGLCTYKTCRVGGYPGWYNWNKLIPINKFGYIDEYYEYYSYNNRRCRNVTHYNNLLEKSKKCRYKDVFHMAARKTYAVQSKKNKSSAYKIKLMNKEIERYRRQIRLTQSKIDEVNYDPNLDLKYNYHLVKTKR